MCACACACVLVFVCMRMTGGPEVNHWSKFKSWQAQISFSAECTGQRITKTRQVRWILMIFLTTSSRPLLYTIKIE